MNQLDMVETKFKAKSETSGNKALAIYSTMQHLEKSMIKANASARDVMRFEKDFLEMNGIAIPDSFMFVAKNSVDDFVENMLIDSKDSITGNDFYSAYVVYCKINQLRAIGKHDTFSYLRSKGLLQDRGTINGLTKK